MEIESKNGSKIRLQKPSETIDFGRELELGFNSTDRTVSRHHISFNLHKENRSILQFQVKGKNPIWVRHCTDDEIRVYKRSERGELKPGDSFCVYSKTPVWFNLNRIACEDEDDNDLDSNIGFDEVSGIDHDEIETGDLSDIDPVKEFNFVVMGHEFDCYRKKLIRDIRNWNWFLEEPNKDSDEEDEEKSRKKRKKGGKKDDNEDDVWTGESEEDAEVMKKLRNDPKPKYSTRSKDKNKKGAGSSKSARGEVKMKATRDDDDDEEYDDNDDEDEGDETLGGFIVDDEDIREGDEDDADDDEEEFEEDEDDE